MATPERRANLALADSLGTRVRQEAAAVCTVVKVIDADRWQLVPSPGVWSIGKEAEHVGDALHYHVWIVRLTIGEQVASRRPSLERARMTTELLPAEAANRIHRVAEESARLIAGLSNDELDRPTRPPRARNALLAETIESVLIGHLGRHLASIMAKLREFE